MMPATHGRGYVFWLRQAARPGFSGQLRERNADKHARGVDGVGAGAVDLP